MKRDGVDLSRSGSFHKVIRLGHLQCQPNHANCVMPYSCGIARIATPPCYTPDRAPYPQSGVAPSFHPGRFVVKRHRARSSTAGELTTQILRFPYHNQPRTEWRIAPCGKPANTHSQHNPQSGIYRAETPRRREPKSLFSASPPLCARFFHSLRQIGQPLPTHAFPLPIGVHPGAFALLPHSQAPKVRSMPAWGRSLFPGCFTGRSRLEGTVHPDRMKEGIKAVRIAQN